MSMSAGERRIVSVLVADVAGSTSIAERIGPERSKFLFDEVVALMRQEIERFGGTVAQLTGDGVLALFGAPVAHEDDPERAVRAALAIGQAISRYDEEIGSAYGIEVRVRSAINTGQVVVPTAGEAPDRLYNALGDTVNVAARLQAYGDLVIGPETARQLKGRFRLEPLGELELKGKDEPVAPFSVSEELQDAVESPRTPLVGREAELALLESAFEELSTGSSTIVVLTGEPGIGKSRLTSEARERFCDRIRFLEGHAVSYAAEIPYWPLRELLRDWLGIGVSDPEARIRLELRTGLAGVLGDDADAVYPFIATLLGLPLDPAADADLRELSRDSLQQQTFDALHRLVCALATERPLCLVFEDLQWADEATLRALEALLAATDDEAVALVLLYRTEGEHGGWDLAEHARRRFRHRFLQIDLEPLEPEAAVELAEGAAAAELPAAVGALLAERAGGNPFFVEEALRDLIERGVLRRVNGRFEVAGDGPVAVPAAVQEALQARLDRLQPSARELVNVASVVGRSFALELLESLTPTETLRSALSELQRCDLIVEERRRPKPEYRFRHGLVQEVAYSGLVQTHRRKLHGAVANALEELHLQSPEEVFGLLAHHFAEAEDSPRAAEYLLKAGDAARALYANDEAMELYRRGLTFLERTGDEERARETLLRIGLTHLLAFRFDRAAEAYVEAFGKPAPRPAQLEPTELLSSAAYSGGLAPGYAHYDTEADLSRHLFRGLVAIGPNYDVLPDLAESWAILEDGLTYRFTLRDDAYWSDGVPVTANDFAYTFRQMCEDDVPTASYLEEVREASAVDERTLEIRLHEPRNYFLYLLGQPPFFAWPQHVRAERGTNWHEHDSLVSNGPFELLERNGRLILTASKRWYGPRGNVRRVELDVVSSPDEIGEQWAEGHYDVVSIAPTAVEVDAPDTFVAASAGAATGFLAFRSDRPPFDDARLRRALAHGIDRERVAEEAGGEQSASTGGILPPTMPGHSHRVAPGFDPVLARRLLAEAGHPEGRGLPTIVLVELENAVFPAAAPISRQLDDLGVQTTIERAPSIDFWEFAARRGDASISGWISDYPDPNGMLEPLLRANPYVYRDERLLGLLASAGSMRDEDARLSVYRQFERLWLGEEVALVPLAYGRRVSWRRPWVSGLWINALTNATFSEAVVRRPA